MRALIAQFSRFGVVGLGGLLVDLALFNALRLTVFAPENIAEGPLWAKVVSTGVAIIVNWVGNRIWTFRAHRGRQLWREFAEFVLVSLGGMAIGLLCLWVSHYLLGFTSILADNIATNVVGLGLGTLFRFTLYRMWVFAPHRGDRAPAVFPATPADAPATSADRATDAATTSADSATDTPATAPATSPDRARFGQPVPQQVAHLSETGSLGGVGGRGVPDAVSAPPAASSRRTAANVPAAGATPSNSTSAP